eukprot:scaffold127137_cov39-Attheya_sp.AAC.3
MAHLEPHPAREWIQMTPRMDIVNVEFCAFLLRYSLYMSHMTAHMEPHPTREWIQMTPMDI